MSDKMSDERLKEIRHGLSCIGDEGCCGWIREITGKVSVCFVCATRDCLAEIDRLKACEHKGCTDKDIHHICDTHMNTDYPCERCKELEAELKRKDELIEMMRKDLELEEKDFQSLLQAIKDAPKPKEASK